MSRSRRDRVECFPAAEGVEGVVITVAEQAKTFNDLFKTIV